jgi:hypothetical protein
MAGKCCSTKPPPPRMFFWDSVLLCSPGWPALAALLPPPPKCWMAGRHHPVWQEPFFWSSMAQADAVKHFENCVSVISQSWHLLVTPKPLSSWSTIHFTFYVTVNKVYGKDFQLEMLIRNNAHSLNLQPGHLCPEHMTVATATEEPCCHPPSSTTWKEGQVRNMYKWSSVIPKCNCGAWETAALKHNHYKEVHKLAALYQWLSKFNVPGGFSMGIQNLKKVSEKNLFPSWFRWKV